MQSVLLLDDDRASCLMLSKMLSSLGYQCDVVHNVADGLRAATKKKYSLIMMDCIMPDQNGWVASHAIQLLPRDGPPPSIIGIMSYPNDEMQRRCASACMAGVIVKPFSKGAVLDCISKARNHQQAITNSLCSCHSNPLASTDQDFKRTGSSRDLDSSLLLNASVQLDMVNSILQDSDQLLIGELNLTLKP